MKSGARIGLAVGLGYILGRRKKLRTALTLAAAVAAGRASRNPGGLMKYGTDLLNASPQLGNLSKLGGPLATAGKAAATAAAGSGIDVLSGKVRGSADALRRKSGAGQPGEDTADEEAIAGERSATDEEIAAEERSAPDEEQELDEQPQAAEDREERPAATASRRRGR